MASRTCLRCSHNVILRDVETHFLDCGIDTTSKKFDHEVKKGKVAEG